MDDPFGLSSFGPLDGLIHRPASAGSHHASCQWDTPARFVPNTLLGTPFRYDGDIMFQNNLDGFDVSISPSHVFADGATMLRSHTAPPTVSPMGHHLHAIHEEHDGAQCLSGAAGGCYGLSSDSPLQLQAFSVEPPMVFRQGSLGTTARFVPRPESQSNENEILSSTATSEGSFPFLPEEDLSPLHRVCGADSKNKSRLKNDLLHTEPTNPQILSSFSAASCTSACASLPIVVAPDEDGSHDPFQHAASLLFPESLHTSVNFPTPPLTCGSGFTTPATLYGDFLGAMDTSLYNQHQATSTVVRALQEQYDADSTVAATILAQSTPPPSATMHVPVATNTFLDNAATNILLDFSPHTNLEPSAYSAATHASAEPAVLAQVAGSVRLADPQALKRTTQVQQRPALRKRTRGAAYDDDAENEEAGGTFVSRKAAGVWPPLTGTRLKPGPKPKTAKVHHPPPTGPIIPPFNQHLQGVNVAAAATAAGVSPPNSAPNSAHGPTTSTSAGAGSGGGTITSAPKELIQHFYAAVEGGVSNGKQYACIVPGCERIFPRRTAVESHVQMHLSDKPFQCTVPNCNAAFVRVHDLRRHEKIHENGKQFKCDFCCKGFARQDACNRHMQRKICGPGRTPARKSKTDS